MNFDLINQEMDKVLAFANALCKEHNEWCKGYYHKIFIGYSNCMFQNRNGKIEITLHDGTFDCQITATSLEILKAKIEKEILNVRGKMLYLNYEQDECPVTDDVKLNGC